MDCDVLDLDIDQSKSTGKRKEKIIIIEEDKEEVVLEEEWEDWRRFELDDRVGESSQSQRRM